MTKDNNKHNDVVSSGIDVSKLSDEDRDRALACWVDGIPDEYNNSGFRLLRNGVIFDSQAGRIAKAPKGGATNAITTENNHAFKEARIQSRIKAVQTFRDGMGDFSGSSWGEAWRAIGSNMTLMAATGKNTASVKAAEFIGKAADLYSDPVSSGKDGGISIQLGSDVAQYLVDRLANTSKGDIIDGDIVE